MTVTLVPWSDKNDKDIQKGYKQLSREQINEEELQKISKASESCLVYGSKEFQESIKNMGSDPKR